MIIFRKILFYFKKRIKQFVKKFIFFMNEFLKIEDFLNPNFLKKKII